MLQRTLSIQGAMQFSYLDTFYPEGPNRVGGGGNQKVIEHLAYFLIPSHVWQLALSIQYSDSHNLDMQLIISSSFFRYY